MASLESSASPRLSKTHHWLGLAVLSGSLLFGGCASQSSPAKTPAPSQASATPTRQLFDDGSSGPIDLGPTFTLDLVSRSTAVTTAVRVMKLYSRRDVSASRWFKDLAPYLTPQAAEVYQYSDPTGAPTTEVLDSGTFLPESSPQLARVSVKTKAGVYLVLLTRNSQQKSWRVDRLISPENAGD